MDIALKPLVLNIPFIDQKEILILKRLQMKEEVNEKQSFCHCKYSRFKKVYSLH